MLLVTGGTGYIGSHTVIVLLEAGFDIVILDNLSNSNATVIDRIEKITGKKPVFVQGDVRDATCLSKIFTTYSIDAVMHFAGLKVVSDSMQKPLEYFDNNIAGSIVLLQAMTNARINRLIFSSSASVYGEQGTYELDESMPTGKPVNNYAYSKLAIEQMLEKIALAEPAAAFALLRYFNPVGAHASGLIGENPTGTPDNLMPCITRVASGQLPVLNIYGDDYPTPDGTAIRDYIHVMDLAEAHLKALLYVLDKNGCFVWNLGAGKGYSVLEIIQQFKAMTQQRVPYRVVPRRNGDITAVWANPDKACRELNWQTKRSLCDMINDSWLWQEHLNQRSSLN